MRHLLAILALLPAGAMAETVGGLEAVQVAPAGHVTVTALDDTACRVPMLVWRCEGGSLAMIYAFDMEVAPETADRLRIWAERDGTALSDPDAWPLTASHRNAKVPAPVAAELLAAARDGAEVHMRLEDPVSEAALRDRFALSGVGAALQALPCAPD